MTSREILSREADKDWLADKNLGWLVYTSILRSDSYVSNEDQVFMLKKMVEFIGMHFHLSLRERVLIF